MQKRKLTRIAKRGVPAAEVFAMIDHPPLKRDIEDLGLKSPTRKQLLHVRGYRYLTRQAWVSSGFFRNELAITLWGDGQNTGEYKTTVTNAELLFVNDEEASRQPGYSEECQRIRVWCPMSHLPAVMKMLQTNQEVCCFYCEYEANGFKEAGLKDWVVSPGKPCPIAS